MMHENCRQKDFFWGAVVGGAVATLTTMLFTTKKGKEIQNKITDTYQEMEESVKGAAAHAKETVKEKAEEATDHWEKKEQPNAKQK
ncbi:MAG: YtxH domain-containing protein [Chlamydiia bacterium]|nr:YtxH domain-containing protein [Chlamydiia bacterium]